MAGDLVGRLRALARHDHSDVSVADEAADELEAASALRPSGEAVANDDTGAGPVTRHHCFIYEVDFGDEGKGRYVRLADFNRVVEELEAHPATPASAWRPIAEAPKDGTRVLIAGGTQSFGMEQNVPFTGVSIAYWYGGYEPHWRGEDIQAHDEWYSHQPTHFMPLPTPPASTSQTAAEQAALERV